MRLKNIKIGFAITGSHCTLDVIRNELENLVKEGAEVFPILSEAVSNTDTRFGAAEELKEFLRKTTKKDLITTITEAEPIGPCSLFDVLVVAPCTGNSLAKLANGITDSTVLMAVKAHLRNLKPVVLAISTNDGLGVNAKNLGILLNTKNIFLVPFGQDNPYLKANSLVAKMNLIVDTVVLAMVGKQVQPVLVSY